MKNKNSINEDLSRFNQILGYDVEKGNIISERKVRRRYMDEYDSYADDDEKEEGGDEGNEDFDFGDEGSPEKEGGDDFDFGDAFDMDMEGDEEGGDEEVDEFGTASEFSAADELEDDEVEEIDVTDIVSKSDEAKEMAQQAVSVGQENSSYLQSLTDKLENLEKQLSKMDNISKAITKLEQDIKTPEEKLELRSLDSYPFNMKLDDYWNEKASQNKHYQVSGGESMEDGQKREYVIKPEDVNDYSEADIKNTFNPEK